MEATPATIAQLRESLGPLAELPEVKGLIDLARQQQQKLEKQQQEIEALKEELRKLKNRTSANSSVPPSQDLLKKPSRKSQKPSKKRGPKYDHPGSTRNGFGQADHVQPLKLEACPVCEGEVKEIEQAPVKRQQVAELVERPVRKSSGESRGVDPLGAQYLVGTRISVSVRHLTSSHALKA